MFYFDEFDGNKILKSDYIQEVTAFFTTRTTPSDKSVEFIKKNYPKAVTPNQTHSSNIEFVDGRTEYPDTDGLILTNPNQSGYLRFADCTPLIFYNPKTKIGAVSHAGWRGTAGKIGIKTLEKMGGDPKDTIIVIGPAIGLCCYEVSEEVKNTLLATVQNKSGLYEGRCVNLKLINARQLQEAGVQKIDICPYCTSCDNDMFYSYRKEGGTAERHYAFLSLS